MKKFLAKIAFFLVIGLLLTVIPPYCIDPYNVFHWRSIHENGVEPNKNYIKTQYLLHEPDRFDAVVLGSSRVGSLHVENIPGERVYNMTYSSGTPEENLATLRTLLDGGVALKTVYIGFDVLSITENPAGHYQDRLRCPYQYIKTHPLQFARLYLDPVVTRQYLEEGLNDGEIGGFETFYDYGWWCGYDYECETDWEAELEMHQRDDLTDNINMELMDQTLAAIQELVNLCREHGIRLVAFTNPIWEPNYVRAVHRGYRIFLERLAGITDYYNFSGINDATRNTDNFADSNHCNAYLADVMLEIMLGSADYPELREQGFGWYVTADNVDRFMELVG